MCVCVCVATWGENSFNLHAYSIITTSQMSLHLPLRHPLRLCLHHSLFHIISLSLSVPHHLIFIFWVFKVFLSFSSFQPSLSLLTILLKSLFFLALTFSPTLFSPPVSPLLKTLFHSHPPFHDILFFPQTFFLFLILSQPLFLQSLHPSFFYLPSFPVGYLILPLQPGWNNISQALSQRLENEQKQRVDSKRKGYKKESGLE